MPTPIDHHDVQRLLAEEQAQLVEVLPAAEFADEHLPGAISIPLKQLDRERAQAARQQSPGDRLLPRLPVRHEPTSRVAAREHRVRAGLRLRRRQGRLGERRACARGRERERDARGSPHPDGRSDLPPGQSPPSSLRTARRERLGHLLRRRRAAGRPRPDRTASDPRQRRRLRRGGDDARAEYDQAQRPTGSDGRADAAPEADEPASDDVGRQARGTADASRRRAGVARSQSFLPSSSSPLSPE
jgi:hypothetical protein